jgi:A118 family predicted phage portal protein
MGLIQGLKDLSDKRDLNISEPMFQQMETWKALYQGYYGPFHDTQDKTISGTKKRRRSSLGMPKVVSEEMATLVFNERCQVNISDETLRKDIEDVLDNNGFRREFQRYLEYMFALGGFVVKAHVEDQQMKIAYVKADSFIPTGWTNKKVTEGVFINETVKGDKTYTHLEWHYWKQGTYYVDHELYEAKTSTGEIGTPVDIKVLYPDLEPVIEFNNWKRPIFVYIKPNSANNVDMDSPMGVSIYGNALDTIKAIDIAFDSFEREFRLGKKRILVPSSAIKYVNDPETGKQVRYFDADDEVYQAFKFDDPEGQKIHDNSVELRVDEHVSAINALLNLFAMQTGFSAGSFSFDGQSMKTATEVVSENSKTFRTKQSHETMIEEGIKDLVEIILDLAEEYELFNRPEDYEVTVTFDDSVAEDKMGDLQYWTQLVSNDLASKKRAIIALLGLTEDEAEDELIRIAEEQRRTTPEAIDFFGLNGGGGSGDGR